MAELSGEGSSNRFTAPEGNTQSVQALSQQVSTFQGEMSSFKGDIQEEMRQLASMVSQLVIQQ